MSTMANLRRRPNVQLDRLLDVPPANDAGGGAPSRETVHSCPKCHRVLRYVWRDSLCARCLAAFAHDEFAEDVKTAPNIRPVLPR
jgi:hypothetical protein